LSRDTIFAREGRAEMPYIDKRVRDKICPYKRERTKMDYPYTRGT
jgi:hypothetical protein